MIQVAAENYSQENFLGLGNKKKQQERKVVRQEKREAKKEARKETKGIFNKIANRVGVGKQATAIRKDVKTAKQQIKTTGSFNRGSVSGGTIRKNPISTSSSVKFGGVRNGKPAIIKTPFGLAKNVITGGINPVAQRGTTPEQRLVSALTIPEQRGASAPVTSENPQGLKESQAMSSEAEAMTQEQAQQANPQTEQGEQDLQAQGQEQKVDGTPKEKPFNWKLWGGIGGGVVLIIVVILIVVFTKK